MDCETETYTFQVNSNGSASNVDFSVELITPIKNIFEASIVTCSLPCSTSNAVYIAVDELSSNFNEVLSNGTSKRTAMGVVYSEDHTTKPRITFYNRYPIVVPFIDPIRTLSKLSVKLYDQTGAPLTDEGPVFITFRFKCARKNLC